jgi:hypothetical protein
MVDPHACSPRGSGNSSVLPSAPEGHYIYRKKTFKVCSGHMFSRFTVNITLGSVLNVYSHLSELWNFNDWTSILRYRRLLRLRLWYLHMRKV